MSKSLLKSSRDEVSVHTHVEQPYLKVDLRPQTPLGVGLSATAAELVAEREAVEGLVLLGSL